MKYRKLGRTGLEVSVIGLGTEQFAGEWSKQFTQPEVDRIFGAAADAGINLIDTAECYGDHLSEAYIGKAIRHNRDRWVIATKFGHKYHSRDRKTTSFARADVLRELDESLTALGVEWIDILQFHSGTNEDFARPGLWEALAKCVAEGKIRHLGISLANSVVLSGDLHQVRSAESAGAEVVQVVYNRLNGRAEEKVLPACAELGLGVMARIPLAKGYLSGKYAAGFRFDVEDVRAAYDAAETRSMLERVERIRATEVPDGVPMAQWALAWCLRHPAVSAVIPGCKSAEQVLANAAAADLVGGDHPLSI